MKIFRLILSAAVFWGALISCNNEIDIYPDNAPEMLYVVGCLDGTGSLQQIKIRKLITGNVDASVMLNDPAYYLPDTSIRVYLEEESGNSRLLSRVIYPSQTGGLFSQDSNLIYEVANFRPKPGFTSTLRIEDPGHGKTLSSQVVALNPAAFTYPVKESVIHSKFRFTDAQRPFHIGFTAASASAWTIAIKYVDVLPDGEQICRKATYCGPPNFRNPSFGQEFSLNYLFLIFNRSIPDDPSVYYRMLYKFDFSIWTGDSILATHMSVAEKFDDNRKQIANNINGGMGLFFATSHDFLINVCPVETLNSTLAFNDSTKHLKFSGVPYTGIYTDPDSTLVNPFFIYQP